MTYELLPLSSNIRDFLAVRQTIYITDYTAILRTHDELVIKAEYKSAGRALIYEPTTVESIKQSPMRTRVSIKGKIVKVYFV